MNTKDDHIDEIKKIKFRFFIAWFSTLLLPLIVIVIYNIALHGETSLNILKDPNYFNNKFFQLYELNDYNYSLKEINNLIIENPSLKEIKTFIQNFKDNNPHNLNFTKTFIMIRKNNKIVLNTSLSGKFKSSEMKNFKNLNIDLLPNFKSKKTIKNKAILEKTGYVISNQIDFYFNDGENGTIFLFRKYTDLRTKIALGIGQNILILLIAITALHSIFAYKMSKKFTKPIENMLIATNEVKKGNFKYQINSEKYFILKKLSMSLNDMIKALNDAKDYRIQVENTKRDFINSLSHDLKTPLTSIKIHVEAIKDGIVNSPEKMQKYLDNILIKVNDLSNMLDELKIFNELDSDFNTYNYQNVNFDLFLSDIIDELQYELENQSIKIIYEKKLNLEPIISIDIDKIKRVVFNIIANSIKYSNSDRLIITFSLINKDNKLILSIKDNGIGIPVEKQELIFNKYYRIDASRNQNKSGSGLGLAIAKTIIENHKGTISVNKDYINGLEIVIKFKLDM